MTLSERTPTDEWTLDYSVHEEVRVCNAGFVVVKGEGVKCGFCGAGYVVGSGGVCGVGGVGKSGSGLRSRG